MHDLLDKYLCQKYPKIFADRNKPMSETCMCWGFSCGNGWFSLIDDLCSSIQHYIDQPHWIPKNDGSGEYEAPPPGTTRCPQLVADQVKEKFSGLRFYCHGGDEYIRGMVDLAEDMSYRICEVCGRMDSEVGRNSKGWIRTTCPEHAGSVEKDFKLNGPKELHEIFKKVNEDEEAERKKKQEEFAKWKAENATKV